MNHGSQYPSDCCNQTSRSQNLCQAEALSGLPLLITEITLLLLSRLTSAPISRADTSDMPSRSHSGEGGQTARNAAQPRRPRPNISRPMGGLGLVESQPIRSKNIWHAAPGTGDNLEGEEPLIATECIAHGWLFVCLVLPIQIRFHAGNRFNWSPVTTITCQFHIVR